MEATTETKTPSPAWDTYPYQPLPTSQSIRLIRIEPREGDEPKESLIRCRIRTVELCPERLRKGEPAETPKRPSVRWDEYITFKHDELYTVLDDKRSTMGRMKDRLLGRTAEQRMNQVIERLPEMSPAGFIHSTTGLIRHEELGDGMQFSLTMEDENGQVSSNVRHIPPEMSKPAIQAPHDEPQYRDRFVWPRVDRRDKCPGNYVAMSYSWGDTNDRLPILIEDFSVDVTRNLEQGLREFRDLEPFRRGLWIWIDAICINQDDIDERDAQLNMMASIYEHAGNTIVWLGPADDTSDAAINFLHVTSINYRTEFVESLDDIGLQTAHAHRNFAHMSLKSRRHVWTEVLRGMAPMLDNRESYEEMVHIYTFFDRPYWRRLWIIQELAMGRAGMPIVCGSTVTQWRYVRDAVLMMSAALDIYHEIIPRAMKQLRPDYEKPIEPSILHVATIAQLECTGHRKPLPSLPEGTFLPIRFHHGQTTYGPLQGNAVHMALRLIRSAHVKENIDRIYGMLAIPGLPMFPIEKSYKRPIEEVIVEFAKYCIASGHSPAVFQLLDGTGAALSDNYKIPFWCPNLGSGKSARRIGIIEGRWHADDPTGQRDPFSWGRQRFEPYFEIEDGEEQLVCYGWVTDAIDGLGAISVADRGNLKFQPLFKGEVVQPTSEPDWPYEDDAETMVWWTLVGSAEVGGGKAPTSFSALLSAIPGDEPPEHLPDHRLWHFINTSKDLLIAGKPLGSYFTPRANPAAADFATAPARQAMLSRTACRRLATTPKGRLALVPASAQPGDGILVLLGHGNPVVATCIIKDDGQNVWKIKGDAFVHGVMEGEAMQKEIMASGRDWFDEFHFI